MSEIPEQKVGRLRPGPRLRAALLVLPLMAFIGVTFLAPLGNMLVRSVYDPVVADVLPETLERLRAWDGQGLPGEAAYEALAGELLKAREDRTLGQVATRINRVQSGLRSVLTRSARRLRNVDEGPWSGAMMNIHAAWGETGTWRALREAGERYTSRHYLNALDLQRDSGGSIVPQPEDRRIYLTLFWRTLLVSLGVTSLCLLIGYPVARPDRPRPATKGLPAPDPGPRALLDLSARAHDVVDRAPAEPGRPQ